MQTLGEVKKVPITSRDQWLGVRRGYVTASDIASICGCGRRSPLAVWAEKTGRVDPGADEAIMQRGRWLEPAVFEALADQRPDWDVRRAKVFLAADDHRLGATPDGVAVVPTIEGLVTIQAKVVAKPIFREKWLLDPDDDFSTVTVPLEYQLQTLTEAMLVNATTAFVAALVIDTYTANLHLLPVERHAGAEQRILDTVGTFWDDTNAGREPALTPGQDHETIKALYPKDNGDEIDLTGDNELPTLLKERDELAAGLKRYNGRKEAVDTIIKAKMGAAASAVTADGRSITLKLQQRAGYAVNPTEFRVLRVGKG